MTKQERSCVVTLLRCAADCGSLSDADITPNRKDRIAWAAWEAKRAVQRERPGIDVDHEDYAFLLLEAARRVEEGALP